MCLVAAVALPAGCGGRDDPGPRLARADAAPLIARADRIARLVSADPCAARRQIEALRGDVVRLVNAGRVPVALQENLTAGVNDLVLRPLSCLPAPAPAPRTDVPPPASSDNEDRVEHGHGQHEKHGKRGKQKESGD